MKWQRLHLSKYSMSMLVFVVLAMLLRAFYITQHWPMTDSDEGIMDLMALHIVTGKERPIFFYGQAYMGSLEAYVGALAFSQIGPTVHALRYGLLIFFASFLISIYFLTKLLYTPRFALFIVALLSLGSGFVVQHQLKAIGGYAETIFFATLLFFLASKLAYLSQTQSEAPTQNKQKQWFLYGLYGFIAGLGIWTFQLLIPFLLTSSLLLFLYCRRELLSSAGWCLCLGAILGASPLLYYNLTHPFTENSLFVLLNMQRAGVERLEPGTPTILRQFSGAYFIGLPTSTGLSPLCSPMYFPLFGPYNTNMLWCILRQGGWSLGYTALWISSFVLSLRSISKQESKQTSRLLLLCSGALSFLFFVLSPSAALYPDSAARYLLCLNVILPAILWPVWTNFHSINMNIRKISILPILGKVGILLLITSMFINGTLGILHNLAQARNTYTQQQVLIEELKKIGATHIYTDYWTGYRLAFASHEQIICIILNEGLKPGGKRENRYTPYRSLIETTNRASYVFAQNSPQLQRLEKQAQKLATSTYRRYEFAGYVVYQFKQPIKFY